MNSFCLYNQLIYRRVADSASLKRDTISQGSPYGSLFHFQSQQSFYSSHNSERLACLYPPSHFILYLDWTPTLLMERLFRIMVEVERFKFSSVQIKVVSITALLYTQYVVLPLGFEPRSRPNLEPYAGYKPVALPLCYRSIILQLQQFIRSYSCHKDLWEWQQAEPCMTPFYIHSPITFSKSNIVLGYREQILQRLLSSLVI